jgi:hypothetical protein
VLWARRVRKPNFQNSEIGMTKGWESLHRELPGTEDPKTRSPEVPKSTEPSRAQKIREIETFS